MRDPRLAKLANVLVNYSVGVKKGNLVRIRGTHGCEPLMLELLRETLGAGGHPVLQIDLEETAELLIKHGNESQLKFVNPLAKFENQKLDCLFHIWSEENTKHLSNVDPKKLSLAESARKPIRKIMFDRAAKGELKWVGTQFPTQGSAQDAEMSLAEYEEFVFRAGLLHTADPVKAWKQVSQRQQKLTDLLNGKSDYRVVAANGTDVRMNVRGHTWINCDGHENFPDGEVFTGPVIDSVNGQINFSFPAVHHGREVQDAKLTFKNGKVVDASATKGEEFLISMLDMDKGSRFLGECAIGTNYSITRYTRNTLFDEKIGGTVHFALGAGYPETGNKNESGLHWDMVVDLRNGGFVEIDGQKISIDGRFTKLGFPG